MSRQKDGMRLLSKQMFALLPVQVLFFMSGAVNMIVSSFFASNYVGIDAMSAVGLYAPLNMLITSFSSVLVGGASILCGKYMGQNEQEKMQKVFSLDMVLSILIAACFIVVFIPMGLFDLTGFMTRDPQVRGYFNSYLCGQAIGILPLMLGNSCAAFLLIENKRKRTLAATLSFIAANVALNWLFVQILHLEAFGLALASSLGMWVFFAVQAEVFLTGKSHFRFSMKALGWADTLEIVRIGLPGALGNIYQTARGLIVNHLLVVFVGSMGLSAFAAANNLLGLVWAIPAGMQSVSRLLISVSAGEEDRETLTGVMRVMFRHFVPIMCTIAAVIILCAVPLTRIFYRDPAEPVYMMTVWGFRILPLCMPLSIIAMHFSSYWQIMGRQLPVHIVAILDGVACVAGFSAILVPLIGMNGVYIANVLNGIVIAMGIILMAWIKSGRFPRSVEQLMLIPEDFGVQESERLDFSIQNAEDVVQISEGIQNFCRQRGISERSGMLAGLCMEEMAGNVVDHGFTKDSREHSVDVRVVHKGEDIILRIKDDCVPFDPGERFSMMEPDDVMKNIGIRMVYRMAKDVQYQNILGLNVLTIRIGGG